MASAFFVFAVSHPASPCLRSHYQAEPEGHSSLLIDRPGDVGADSALGRWDCPCTSAWWRCRTLRSPDGPLPDASRAARRRSRGLEQTHQMEAHPLPSGPARSNSGFRHGSGFVGDFESTLAVFLWLGLPGPLSMKEAEDLQILHDVGSCDHAPASAARVPRARCCPFSGPARAANVANCTGGRAFLRLLVAQPQVNTSRRRGPPRRSTRSRTVTPPPRPSLRFAHDLAFGTCHEAIETSHQGLTSVLSDHAGQLSHLMCRRSVLQSESLVGSSAAAGAALDPADRDPQQEGSSP